MFLNFCHVLKKKSLNHFNFKVVENIRNHNDWDNIKGIFFGIIKFFLFILFIPFLFLLLLFGKREKKDNKIENEWTILYTNNNFEIERLYINEDEIPDDLDFPQECNDIYLFKIRTNTNLPVLNEMYFDYQTIKSENGIYLLSWNKEKEGMTFWFIDDKTQKLNKIRDLESNWWNLSEKNEKVVLLTKTKNKDITIEIDKI